MIVVTGASGLVGSNLVRALVDQNQRARALVHRDRRGINELDVELAGAFFCIVASIIMLGYHYFMIIHWGIGFLAVSCGTFFIVMLGQFLGVVINNQIKLNVWIGLVMLVLIAPIFIISVQNRVVSGSVKEIFSWFPGPALTSLFAQLMAENYSSSIVFQNSMILVATGILIFVLIIRQLHRTNS